MLQKLKMLGLLLVVIGVSIVIGFRVKLYMDGQKQEAIKTNFRNLCKAYQEKYIGDDGSAYIGNMEVRDGDIIKWNTYQEAYDVAAKLVDKRRK